MTIKSNTVPNSGEAKSITKANNVYGYIRVSTETQADKGYGLDIQKSAIEEYCTTNNLNLLDIFIDAGKSGTIGEKDNLESRPAITELLYTLNGTKTILVMNTSRLWRDNDVRALVSMAVRKSKGDIISIEQPSYSLYSKDPQEFLFNSMMEMLDQYERMIINKRLTKGKNEKAKQGYKPAGKTPLGYNWNAQTKLIEINHKEAELVKEIFETTIENSSFLEKNIYQIVADILNKQCKLGRKHNQWSRNSISAVLNNKFYTGILLHQQQEIIGKHELIIDNDTFNKVAAIVTAQHNLYSQTGKDINNTNNS